MSNFTQEQIEAAKAAKSPEELVKMAKDAGHEITLEQAEAFLANPKQGELADEELDNVVGGAKDFDHGSRVEISWGYDEKMNNIWAKVDAYASRFSQWGVDVKSLKKKIEEKAKQKLDPLRGWRYYAKLFGIATVYENGTYEVK